MISNLLRRFRRKGRKFPIRRDEFGMTRRQWSFYYFDHGMLPAEVAPKVGISKKTSRKYYSQWKKLPRDLEKSYRVIKEILKRHPEFSELLLKNISDQLGLPLDELSKRLQEPWGLRRTLMVRSGDKGNTGNGLNEQDKFKQWARLRAAISIIHLYDAGGVPLERIMAELDKLDKEYRSANPKVVKPLI
jgi:transposase